MHPWKSSNIAQWLGYHISFLSRNTKLVMQAMQLFRRMYCGLRWYYRISTKSLSLQGSNIGHTSNNAKDVETYKPELVTSQKKKKKKTQTSMNIFKHIFGSLTHRPGYCINIPMRTKSMITSIQHNFRTWCELMVVLYLPPKITLCTQGGHTEHTSWQ